VRSIISRLAKMQCHSYEKRGMQHGPDITNKTGPEQGPLHALRESLNAT